MTDTAAPRAGAEEQSVALTVDGRAIAARPGELIINAAERSGVYIPRFCYHPRMEPVGMCRMCLVEVSGPRGFSLQPACFLRVADGMEILTESPRARKAQEGVLEFLLLNHPLDCPVCDKGGECPLQDQSVSHGPGESRFVEEKRHWAKPIEIGHFVALDRERCIQCARCTRFSDEIAGDAGIDFAERGDRIEVAPFPTEPFNSYFSGNTIQICPVGALTARPYRFKARPWDLEQVESTCTTCAVGCRYAAQSSAGQLVRFLGVDVDPVNQSWLCDKGRFSYETLYAQSRVTQPQLRTDGPLAPVRWHEALARVAAAVRDVGDPGRIGVIGGARLSNEDAYAWAKFAKGVLRTDSVDAQLGDGLPAEAVLGLPRATIEDATTAKAVLLLAGDLREELPVLFLRLRAAATKAGVAILEASPVPTALSPLAALRLPYLPGEAPHLAEALASKVPAEVTGVTAEQLEAARGLIGDGEGVVVVLGRPSIGESGATIAAAASRLHAAFPGVRFLSALRRANVHGALDMGLAPGILPGRRGLGHPGAAIAEAWPGFPEAPGRDAAGVLEAAANGEIDVLFLLGADPLSDFPDRALAKEALERVPTLVALATHLDPSAATASVVLPVVGDGERSGTTTNLEGRVSRLVAKVLPPGVAWAPWVVAEELAARLGVELGFDNLETITEEISLVAPAYAGVTPGLLGTPAFRDGVVVPLTGPSGTGSPRPIDPMATPGIAAVEEQGAPQRVGAAVPSGGEPEPLPESPDAGAGAAVAPPSPEVVAPRLDAYSHRLVLRRSLYDEGTLVSTSPSMVELVPPVALAVHPADLAQLGLSSGDRVRVRSAHGEAVLEATTDERVARHVVAARLSPTGSDGDLRALVSAGTLATDVHLETL